MEMRERFTIIDIWISLLLCLVILGHCSVSGAPEYYGIVKTWIYSFHMAAFYFVCGFLIRHTYQPLDGTKAYGKYILRKLKKFGIPFLVFGVMFCVLATLQAGEGNLTLFVTNLGRVFVDTAGSVAIYLWFIYVLFEYYLIAPILCQFYKQSILPAFAVAGLLLFFPLPRLFNLHQFSRYLLFLLLGISARQLLPQLRKIHWEWALLPALAFPLAVWEFPYSTISGLLSLPALWLASLGLSKIPKMDKMSGYLSRNCFPIYLWQLIFVHLLSVAILRYLQWPFWNFMLLVIPVAIVCSIGIHNGIALASDFVFSRYRDASK